MPMRAVPPTLGRQWRWNTDVQFLVGRDKGGGYRLRNRAIVCARGPCRSCDAAVGPPRAADDERRGSGVPWELRFNMRVCMDARMDALPIGRIHTAHPHRIPPGRAPAGIVAAAEASGR
eukprot:365566-Chlamydomonas_euryale.AAC.11